MNVVTRLMSGAAIALVLGTLPALADKISAGGKNSSVTTSTPAPAPATIDFGDDTSQWAKDGECDDPRFSGSGSAAELEDVDILKDATDCKAAYDAGTVTLNEAGSAPADVAVTSPADAIDWGDDSSEYAKDGECDDPRFAGTAMGAEPLLSNTGKDASDCRTAYQAGTVTLKDVQAPPQAAPTAPPIARADLDFGDDSGEWANDGECDDPRFSGTGAADELVDADLLKDATDCQAAYQAGTVTFNADYQPAGVAAIDYGDDSSKWAKDGECDDPRFSGTGVAGELVEEDRGHDATDCRAAVQAGTATYNGETGGTTATTTPAAFDYGTDFSKWANDGECDDLRFEGAGVDKKLLTDDLNGDATDCRAAVEAGTATIRTVYSPEYAAGAPYDSAGIDFGDNSSDYADDQSCDDPRFEGPGTASILLDDDAMHDSNDCKAAYEAGRIMLVEG